MSRQLPTHPRVIKAKISRIFANKIFSVTAVVFVLFMAVIAIAMIVTGDNQGYICLFPLPVLFMAHEWYTYDLKENNPKLNSDNPIDYLAASLLASLKNWPLTLSDLLVAIKEDNGRNFIRNRFLIFDQLIDSSAPISTEEVFTKAKQLFEVNKVKEGVDGAYILVAIILNSPQKQDILKTINYSEEELVGGLAWYSYLVNSIDSIKQKQSSGGLARDWATGYTPLLNRFAQNISYSIQYGGTTHRDIFSREKVVDAILSIFSSSARANVALVGETGAGKHICVQGLADRLLFDTVPTQLKYLQIYQIDVSSLLTSVEASSIEKVLNELLVEAFHAKNIVLFFNNAGQLFGSDQIIDVSNFLQPIISAGRVRMIFSFTDSQWQYLKTNKPAISAVFNYQAVQPTDEHETIKILENEAIFVEMQYKCIFTYESLKEIYRLGLRYGPEVAMPSKAISVMESAARQAGGGLVYATTVQAAIENSTGIKVGATTSDEKNRLLNLEQELHQRVIGQERAVGEVVGALKRNRSGVSSSNKPIGTFLFLGPTGVGKTELSKALAATYFGQEENLVRLDMNEYITKESVSKLLASGNQQSPTFIDQIKKQPYSVVLLDEIEKADSSIINIFLQVLDEGMIIDDQNKAVSFRDAIIIATSNAGADFIRQAINDKKDIERATKELTNSLIQNNTFKPEFINRFDETIIFRPLSITELEQVVVVLATKINKELANQKITIALSPEAISWLAEQGHDPVMGARPLRRLMQKTIETLVADKILSQEIASGDSLTITQSELAKYLPS